MFPPAPLNAMIMTIGNTFRASYYKKTHRTCQRAIFQMSQRGLPTRGKSFIRSGHSSAEKRSKYEDYLSIMSLRWRKQSHCQRLSKNRNHALVLPYFTRHALYHVEAIEGRPIPRVPRMPRSERSPDETKRMEGI